MQAIKRIAVLRLVVWLSALPAVAATPWHHPLYLVNRGYWSLRVPVQIINEGTNTALGEPVAVSVSSLAGAHAESLRVCNADGQELLFDIIGASGETKRQGRLVATDRLVVPAECGPKGSTLVYLYAGNVAAMAVPDFFRFGVLNGGLESGADSAEEWSPAVTDAQHRASCEKTGGHGGTRCVKTEVDSAAQPTWVQWRQTGIPITPGRTYELTGWLRADSVVGRAGWFVHVDGDRPQLINQVATTDGGTHDWRQVRLTFTAPPTSRSATVGTVLYGTGRAWFDDVSLAIAGDASQLRAVAGPLETLRLEAPATSAPAQFTAECPVRAVVRVLNVNNQALDPVLVMADLRPALGRWMKIPPGAEARVLDGVSGKEIPSRVRSENNLLFSAALPPRSLREFHVYLNPARKPSPEASLSGYEQLLTSRLNFASSPSFEETTPTGWSFSDEPNQRKFAATPGSIARFGQRGLEFTVATNLPTTWTGWRSREIHVRPGASYFYSGFLKAQGLDGIATLHAHWHTKEGKLTATSAFVGTQPTVSGDSDWTQSTALVQAPPDAASVQLHLTMNAHGTLRHDGILFCEVQRAEVLRLETVDSARKLEGLHVWQANPLIKVFPDDPPAQRVESVTLECARNEYEPLQLIVRSSQVVKNLQVTVSPLLNAKGDALPALKTERVGYVPVDHPSGYFSSRVADWYRKVPQGPGATDGWAGWWPDPLLPAAADKVAANQNQPFWLTVRTPRDTAPGEYRGEVAFRAEGLDPITLPLTVKVLPFTLPERTQLRAIFDFRFGSGGDFGSGKGAAEDRRRWLRFMAEHRLGVDAIEPTPEFRYEKGKVTMAAAAFDEAARYCFDELGMNAAYTPWFFYLFGWAYPPKRFFGLEPFTPQYNDAFQQAYRLFSEHVRQKGWHDKFVYYISDEPHFQHEFVIEQMKKLCALVHAVDPKIPIYSSTWRHCPAWDQALDIWGVGQHGSFPISELEPLRRAGKQFWWTCDGQMATDTPYLATERLLPYYCFKYGASGFEFWGLAWWTYDPWRLGWHTFIRQSDEGKDYYWVRYPNGDGFLAYPGKPVGVEGPVSTIRLEEVREGLEDFEALSLLTGLIEKAKAAERSTASGERALALAKELVSIPNAGGLRSTEILSDPDQIPAVRKAVNAAIVELGHNR